MSCTQKISESSALAFNSALNIFSVPPTNVSVNRSYMREILPLSTVTQDGPYLFRMFSDNLWTDLSRLYLYLDVSIQKQTDKGWVKIDATDDKLTGPIQALGQTFIHQLKVSVANSEVYDSSTVYAYKAYMTAELSHSSNAKANFMAAGGYQPTTAHDSTTDAGFVARCAQFAGGRRVQLLSRLDFDLGNQELFLLNQIDVCFTIYRAKNEFLLQALGAGPHDYRLYVHDIKLYAKMIDVQPSLNLSIFKALEKQPATYAVRRTEVRTCFISVGRTEINHNVFSSTIPRRLTIGLVANAAFNGDLALSPFNFKPYGVREISVQAGGLIYPVVPYRLNFTDDHYVRAYVDMYEALGCANADHSCDISMQQFKAGWCFFIIPLTSTLDDSCGFELLRSGTTSVRIEFADPVPAGGIEMICLGEFDQMLMIDYNRHVVSDSTLG